jgi:hypothetical protein
VSKGKTNKLPFVNDRAKSLDVVSGCGHDALELKEEVPDQSNLKPLLLLSTGVV